MTALRTSSRVPKRPSILNSISITSVLLILILALTPVLQAELASSEQTAQVCQNWLTKMVYQKGEWAGNTDPQILSSGEMFDDSGRLLARFYNIAPQGYVIVPVLMEMSPVKAYSDQGSIDDVLDHPITAMLTDVLVSTYNAYESLYGSLDVVQPDDDLAMFDISHQQDWGTLTLSSEEYVGQLSANKNAYLEESGPLLSSSWNQGSPYNDLCPIGAYDDRTVVGCVSTAGVQIMNYWQWPANGYGSYTNNWEGDYSCDGTSSPGADLFADFSDSYDWDDMPDNCDGGCNSTQENALAELSYEVGVAYNMNYGVCGSGASFNRGLMVFTKHFRYSQDIDLVRRVDNTVEDWYQIMKTEIDASRVADYHINMHLIVMDGYRSDGSTYECHLNYGWTNNGYDTWYVLDNLHCSWISGDICPFEEEEMLINIKPQDDPLITLDYFSIDDSGADADGHADPGETVTFLATVENQGRKAYLVNGELLSNSAYVTIINNSVSYSTALDLFEQASSQTDFEFSVDISCPDPYVAELVHKSTCSGGYEFYDTIYIHVGDVSGFSDDFEIANSAWNHDSFLMGYLDQWHREDYRAHSGTTSWKVGGADDYVYTNSLDASLITPPVLLPENAIMSFWHWLDVEDDAENTAWDGAVVMISTAAGQWEQIAPLGGYPYTIIENPASPFASGTPCFSGTFDWSQVSFDLSAYSGVVQIMFRFGTDGAAIQEGWYIDDLVIDANLIICADANSDGGVNVSDAVYLINYVFTGGGAPNPVCTGDANNDDSVNVSDAVYIINYVFVGGDAPSPDCCN